MVLDTTEMCVFCNCGEPPIKRAASRVVSIGDFPTPLCEEPYQEYVDGELLARLQFDIYGDTDREYT